LDLLRQFDNLKKTYICDQCFSDSARERWFNLFWDLFSNKHELPAKTTSLLRKAFRYHQASNRFSQLQLKNNLVSPELAGFFINFCLAPDMLID